MTSSGIRLAAAPVSWGVDFLSPGNPPWSEVLDGIASAGVRWAELGPAGYLPPDAARAALAARGLGSVGTFVFEDLHRPDAARQVLDAADRALAAIAAAGGRLLLIIDRSGPDRAATAGRSDAARRLDGRGWRGLVATVRRTAERAADRGVRAVIHPHAGSFLEFEDEVDRLLGDVPRDELGLCLDTGHALYAGADPAAAVERYAGRLEHLHVKDLDAGMAAQGLDIWTAIARGAFCPIGAGALDLPALRGALAAARYAGFATVEQDRRPDSPGTPVDDLRTSVERLRAAGIG